MFVRIASALGVLCLICCLVLVASAGTLDEPLDGPSLSKVIDYLVEHLVDPSGEIRTGFDAAEIARATGVLVTDAQQSQLLPALMARLQQSEEGRALAERILSASEAACAVPAACAAHGAGCEMACGLSAASANRCAQYSACSLHGDLSAADGETLLMYQREKASDGALAEPLPLPALELVDLQGQPVSLTASQGRPMSVLFIAGHCSHSFQTLPAIPAWAERAAAQGIDLALVVINSGAAADVAQWIGEYELDLPIYVASDPAIGDMIGSHLVPTQLLVNQNADVERRLVGYKSPQEVDRNWDEVFGPAAP